MTSAFGGQRSIQLSYGCVSRSTQNWIAHPMAARKARDAVRWRRRGHFGASCGGLALCKSPLPC